MSTTLAAVDFDRGLSDAWRAVITFVPKLIAFLLILVIGYFVAKFLAKAVDKILERVGFDRVVERGGVKQRCRGRSTTRRTSWRSSSTTQSC